MASVVGICNSALISLGVDTIMSLTENSPQARACNNRYEEVRDSVLRLHAWGCATSKVKLQRLSTAPVFTWEYAYQLPSDCIRPLSLSSGDTYEIVGRTLETNDDDPYLKYIKRLTDVQQMDSLLRETIAARLAAEIAYSVTKDFGATEFAWKIFTTKMLDAISRDADENKDPEQADSSWLDARL